MGREEQDREGFIPGGQPGGKMPVPTIEKRFGVVRLDVGQNMGSIAAVLSSSGITLVTVVVGSTVKPLWSASSGYVSPAPTVTVGLGWEIHTTYNMYSDGPCGWFMTCMVNSGSNWVPASPTGGHGEHAGSPVNLVGQTGWDFNMPAMVAAGQSIRLKLWAIADQYTAYPAQSLW